MQVGQQSHDSITNRCCSSFPNAPGWIRYYLNRLLVPRCCLFTKFKLFLLNEGLDNFIFSVRFSPLYVDIPSCNEETKIWKLWAVRLFACLFMGSCIWLPVITNLILFSISRLLWYQLAKDSLLSCLQVFLFGVMSWCLLDLKLAWISHWRIVINKHMYHLVG